MTNSGLMVYVVHRSPRLEIVIHSFMGFEMSDMIQAEVTRR